MKLELRNGAHHCLLHPKKGNDPGIDHILLKIMSLLMMVRLELF